MTSTQTSEEDVLESAVDMTCVALVEVYKIGDVKLCFVGRHYRARHS
jgi:hypothetical protein